MTNESIKYFADFQQQILSLDDAVQKLQADDTLTAEQVSEMIYELSQFKTQLGMVYNSLCDIATKKMNDGEVFILSTGYTVEKTWDKNRKGWQHKDLASVVAEKIQSSSVDMDTGEVVLSTKDMITALLDYVQPSYWRVTALSNIGVDADDFCQAGEPEPKISIRKTK